MRCRGGDRAEAAEDRGRDVVDGAEGVLEAPVATVSVPAVATGFPTRGEFPADRCSAPSAAPIW